MHPSPLDEYPIHQSTLSMGRVATSDSRFYDRSYFNAHDHESDTVLVTGIGVYPNIGLTDAFVMVRHGSHLRTVCFSDGIDSRSLNQGVGPYGVDVVEPLRTIRVFCESEGDLALDLTWHSDFPAVFEPPQIVLSGPESAHRAIYDTNRFGQVGSWSGTLRIAGEIIQVNPDTWTGFRDRSWGVRPMGTPTPKGEVPDRWSEGFWWSYVPLQFDDFFVMILASESPDGVRRMNEAVRVFADGSVEHLGWAGFDITYRPGTRTPETVSISLTGPRGEPHTIELDVRTSIPLGMGSGYVTDWEWVHGMPMGPGWSRSRTFDLDDPDIAALAAIGISDYPVRARWKDQVGWGMFEHACIGRHDPSGFTGHDDLGRL